MSRPGRVPVEVPFSFLGGPPSLAARYLVDEYMPEDGQEWRVWFADNGDELSMAPFDRHIGWRQLEGGVVEPLYGLGDEVSIERAAERLGLDVPALLQRLDYLFTVLRAEQW